jgi:hypothetical protein
MPSRAIAWGLLGCGVTLIVAGVFACGSPPSPQTAQTGQSGAPDASSAPPPSTAGAARAVTAVVLMNRCAHFGVDNARLAQAAINALVDGCTSFAGDRVQFTATLLPGGAIQFEPGPKDSTAIPVCVLNHPLTHRVQLQKACSLDVRLEQTSVIVPKSADAGP